MPGLDGDIQILLDVTTKMLKHAKESDWDALESLENQRKLIIHSAKFQSGESVDKFSQNGLIIQQVLKMDEEIQRLASLARDKARDELITLNRNKNKAKAYQFK